MFIKSIMHPPGWPAGIGRNFDVGTVVSDFDKMLKNWSDIPKFATKSNLSIVSDITYVTDSGQCVVELVIPGYSKDDVSVNVTEEKLTISAKKKEDRKQGLSLLGFTQAYLLDKKWNVDTVSAVHKDGVLTVTLQPKEKSTEKDARKVEIK